MASCTFTVAVLLAGVICIQGVPTNYENYTTEDNSTMMVYPEDLPDASWTNERFQNLIDAVDKLKVDLLVDYTTV